MNLAETPSERLAATAMRMLTPRGPKCSACMHKNRTMESTPITSATMSSVYPLTQWPSASSRPVRALSSRRAARHAAKGGCASSRASSSGSLARAKRLEKPRLISVRKRWAQFEEGATPISRQRACTTQSAASSDSAVRAWGSRRSKPMDQHCKAASGKA